MENTKDQEPTPDTKEREGVRENKAVETTTSTPVDNDMESTTYQVPNPEEAEPECLNEIETVEPITSAPVQDEMESTSDQVSDPMEAEPECLKEIETVEPFTSAPVQGEMESTSDQVPNPMEAEPECLNENENVQPVTSAPVQSEMESTRDQIPCSVQTLKNCPRSTSAPVLDEMRNYEADDDNSVSDNANDIAELKEQIRALQEQLSQRDLVIKKQRKSLEKVTGALGDNQSQQYQKDAHKCEGTQKTENGDKAEIDELPASNNAQSSSGPSTVRKVFQFVRHVGFYVGYTIVKYNLLSPQ
ncbi:uncharacterized protein LOC122959315 isoform X1 [Acropora millepora]|uniref:uncharacterized protein LOC122959315 isoform X1 n=1 Tax=Acropora millepora TaxID=45264 RepID=UPI001CF21CC9|nr:uncharacterized protein LOC122959315 isoform X1 [Acropora millepora]